MREISDISGIAQKMSNYESLEKELARMQDVITYLLYKIGEPVTFTLEDMLNLHENLRKEGYTGFSIEPIMDSTRSFVIHLDKVEDEV